jgi:endonuclease/exonuclease/phosphatase family metal-dependent hydrolase
MNLPAGRSKRVDSGRLVRLFALLSLAGLLSPTDAAIIAQWSFNSTSPDADATTGALAPAVGVGSATLVGGVTGSFTASNGSSDPNPTDNSNWRITTWPAQDTQNKRNGVEFKVGTAGYGHVAIRWDQRHSNTASRYVRLQYTTNGTEFVDLHLIVMPNETWMNGQSLSLEGVPGVEDNPWFGVRFVTEFESTASGAGTNGYVPSNPGSAYGSAGTLRLDMVTFIGEPRLTNFSLLSYNVLGRDQADWTTNSAQVRAIGRQMAFLKPDIIGFQEIPETNANYLQMTGFVAACLPGYHLATRQRTDGGERSVVASRFPILRSKSWLARSDLTAFGYAGVFTRDLFEAEILMPGLPQPLHFFTTHLKAHPDEASSLRRAAEARAISNYFVTAYLTTNALRPCVLVGDMNEDIHRPRAYEQGAIQTLTSPPTGLRLTTPRHPVTTDDRTWSVRNANLTIRFDYILPCGLLWSNMTGSQVFRSDQVSPPVPPLLASDSATAADHLPVIMTFRNPYDVPLVIRGLTLSNQVATIRWTTIPGDRYLVESSTNLTAWEPAAAGLVAQTNELSVPFTVAGANQFFRVARER